MKNLTVSGCIGSPGVWPAAIRFLERTGIDLSPIQTHKFSLNDAVKGFELGQDPKACIKITLSTEGLN
jgi:L-iditol 2-dehydrogenase